MAGGFQDDALEPFVRIMPVHKAVGLTVLALSLVRPWSPKSVAPEIETGNCPSCLFCRIDCWMDWNAARRLAAEGYDNTWLAEGGDGWRKIGEVAVARPVARQNRNQQSAPDRTLNCPHVADAYIAKTIQ